MRSARSCRIGVPVFLPFLLLLMWGCGGRDPVQEMQKSLAAAPDYVIILEDMREDGLFFPQYYQRYKVVQGSQEVVTDWIEVPGSVYEKYKPFLGMALASKTDKGVNDTAHPAGYDFVGNPRYGQWQQQDGRSFWVFYGQYAMMRNLLGWGSRPIYRGSFDEYRTYRQQRRPYYGTNREYGTSGSLTRRMNPSYFERRMRAMRWRRSSFSQRIQSRIGRSRIGFGGRGGGFGK